jgi:hypothetical protein
MSSGAVVPPDKKREWLFKFKGIKNEARSALWAAMDMSNLLIASDDEEIVMRQNTTSRCQWLTLQLSWGYRNLAQLMENGLDARNMSLAVF